MDEQTAKQDILGIFAPEDNSDDPFAQELVTRGASSAPAQMEDPFAQELADRLKPQKTIGPADKAEYDRMIGLTGVLTSPMSYVAQAEKNTGLGIIQNLESGAQSVSKIAGGQTSLFPETPERANLEQHLVAGDAGMSDYSNALLSTLRVGTIGNAVNALTSVIPAANVGSSIINNVVNPAIVNQTGINLANLQASELIGGAALGAKYGYDNLGNNQGNGITSPYQAYKSQGGPLSVSDNILAKNFLNDNIAPSDLPNKLSSLGPEGMLADAGGENVKGVARAIANMQGPAREIAINALEERQAGQVDRLTQAATKGLGIPEGATADSTIDELIKQREQNAKPAYEEAFNSGPIVNEKIDQFLSNHSFKTGLARGLKIQELESLANGEKFDPKDYGITGFNESGDPIISGVPNMRLLDAAKKGVDAQISDNTDPVTGKVNELGRALTKARNSYVSEIDKINPKYAEARDSYAGPSQSKDAIIQGQDFIKNGGEINSKILSKIPDSNKPFFRIGVAQKISDILQNTPDGADAVKRIFGTPAKRTALKSVFPDDESFKDFENIVKNEGEFTKTYQAATKGSRTAPLAEDIANTKVYLTNTASKGIVAAKHLTELGQRNTIGKVVYGVSHLANKLAEPVPLNDNDAVNLANKLFTPNYKGNSATISTPARTSLVGSYINHLMNSVGSNPVGTAAIGAASGASQH